jgi:putative ABC transport system substrate-binding protein
MRGGLLGCNERHNSPSKNVIFFIPDVVLGAGEAMRRREFITLLGGATSAWPLAARAQQSERVLRIGVLMGYAETDPSAQAQVEALRQGLQRLGWEEGRNILIDVRFPAADTGRVRAILTELMSLAPDLLVTNTNLVTAVVQAEVRTIPIVFISVGDPVGAGFVSDEARPTGNLTGFANWRPSLGEKWLEQSYDRQGAGACDTRISSIAC